MQGEKVCTRIAIVFTLEHVFQFHIIADRAQITRAIQDNKTKLKKVKRFYL